MEKLIPSFLCVVLTGPSKEGSKLSLDITQSCSQNYEIFVFMIFYGTCTPIHFWRGFQERSDGRPTSQANVINKPFQNFVSAYNDVNGALLKHLQPYYFQIIAFNAVRFRVAKQLDSEIFMCCVKK